MMSIDPFWVVADLTSGYHQIRIPPADKHLFGVLLESGLYVYRYKPMGFINRGHSCVNRATSLLEGTEVKIEVDDVIIGRNHVGADYKIQGLLGTLQIPQPKTIKAKAASRSYCTLCKAM